MAVKIAGYNWQYNYRGFDVYNRRNTWLIKPGENLIAKDLATEEHTHKTNDPQYVFEIIDQHWEVTELSNSYDFDTV